MNGELRILPEMWLELMTELNSQVKGRNIPAERSSDFWEKLLDLASRLKKADPARKHGDPNLTTLWYVSMLLGAWVLTVGKAKLNDPQRTETTDGERREMRDWLSHLPASAHSVNELGLSLGKEFQRQFTDNLWESWENSEDPTIS